MLICVKNVEFPSPLGDLYISMAKGILIMNREVSIGFRPLSGTYISQLELVKEPATYYLFPSPLGDLYISIILQLLIGA